MATAAGSIDRASETGMSTDPGLSQLNSGDPHQQVFTDK